jgi:hypothetical protein
MLALSGAQAFAQLPSIGGLNPAIPGQPQQNVVAFPDSAKKKDTKVPVARKVIPVSPQQVRYGGAPADTLSPQLYHVSRWDETDSLAGFSQRLGSIGKPILRYENGLSDQYRDGPLYRDPLTDRTDVFTETAEYQLNYFDTRTPFVQLRFDNGGRSVQLLSFDISQNITPFWNATLHYHRRTSLGAYVNSAVDHYSVGATMSFRSFSHRFAATLGIIANQLQDNLSGGLEKTWVTNPLEGLRTDKFTVPTLISGGVLSRRVRQFYGVASLRLIGDSANAITVVGGLRFNEVWRKYEDRYSGDSTDRFYESQNQLPYRPYGQFFFPAIAQDSGYFAGFRDEYFVYQTSGFVGARFNLRVGPLQSTLQAELEGQYLWAQDALPNNIITQGLEQTKTTLRGVFIASDTAAMPRFGLRALAEVSTNTLLSEELKLSGTASWSFLRRRYELTDSQWVQLRGTWVRRPVRFKGLYLPLSASADLLFHNRNPALFDRFWRATTFAPDATLSNESVLSIGGSVRWEGRPHAGSGYLLLRNYASIRGFVSARIDPIIYTSAAQPEQVRGGQLSWQGLTAAGRVRLWRFYLENSTTAQVSATSGAALARYGRAQPKLYGQANLFFRNRIFREGQTYVQAGVEAHYFTSYTPLSFESSLQSWYPQLDTPVDGYVRLDAYVSAALGNAQVFFRFTHFNEYLTAPGYFTTPFYPMLERTFSFGVTWRFYN